MLNFDVKLFVLLQFSLVFDWIFQTHWEASNKMKSWRPRATHSLTYAWMTWGLIWLYGYNFWLGLCIYIALATTHFLIDDRKLVGWIMRNIKQMKMPDEELRRDYWWLAIGIDQCLHTLVNFIIATVVIMI